MQPPGNEINFAAVSQNCRISKNVRAAGSGVARRGRLPEKLGNGRKIASCNTMMYAVVQKLTNKYKRVRRSPHARSWYASGRNTHWSDSSPVALQENSEEL